MWLTAKLGMLAAAGAAAALAAGVVPAQASTGPPGPPGGPGGPGHGRTISGPEFIQGAAYGPGAIANNPVIPVRLAGLVWARGVLATTGGPPATFYTNRGIMYSTQVGGPLSQNQYVNPRTCYAVYSETFRVAATGGTGAFSGARGFGLASVNGGSFVPRYPNGQCNPNLPSNNPQNAFINGRAHLWLTVRQYRHFQH